MKLFVKRFTKFVIISLLVTACSFPGNLYDKILSGNIPSGIVAAAEEVFTFHDVTKSSWYYEDLQYILRDERQIFSGYPDGTFRPNETLTVDMYIKLIVTVMGYEVENGKEYWASTYIDKAIEEGLIIPWLDTRLTFKSKDDPYAGYKRPINRGDMALIAGRAFDNIIDSNVYRDPIAVSSLIKDYHNISPLLKSSVVKFYDLGILTGYPDGEFKADNILTRAEAVAVIRRIIDPSARKRVDLPIAANPSPTPIPVNELNRPAKKDLGNGVVEVEGIRFDPATDIVNPSNGAMGILKAEEFVGVALEYLTFYEHEGKARVRGYIPELPDGYEWLFAIHCTIDGPDDRGLGSGTISNDPEAVPEKRLPGPGKTFDMPLYTKKENILSLGLVCEIKNMNNYDGGTIVIYFTEKRYSRYDSEGGHSLVDAFDTRGFFEW